MVSTNSVIFVFLSVLISTVLYVEAQPRPTGNSTLYTTFTARVSIYNDPAVSGRLSGTLYYGWKNTTRITTKRIDYNIGPSDILRWDDTSTTRYTKCDTSCEAETSADRPEYLFVQTVDRALGYSILLNGVTCYGYNRTNTTQQANSLVTLFADITGKLCRVIYFSGKVMDFTQVSNTGIPADALNINPAWNCPVAKCDALIDLIYLFDMSGSINDANYEIARGFTYNLSDSFNIGSDAVRIGIIFFETVATVILPISNSKANVLQTVSTMARRNGGTQIARGLNAVRLNMPTSRNGVNVSKIMIIFTDAKPSDPTLWYPAWKNLTDTGVISITVGVGSINRNNLWNMSSTVPGLQTFWTSPNYESLGNLLKNGFVAQACQPLPGIGYCGVNCKGYCSCNKQCLCPDNCDDNSVCTNDKCTVDQNGNGCQNTPIVCEDNNPCTDKFCDAVGGCYFQNKSAGYCDDGIKCTNDVCTPGVGCQYSKRDCKDDDPCTLDSCDENTGQCSNVLDYQCVCSRKTCPFLNNCTTNICDITDGVCKPASVDCNDNNFCTDDSCNPATGCVYTAHDCSDASLCTFDQCDSVNKKCVNPPITCDDGDICTENNCLASSGCVYPPKPASYCDDGNPCTNDTCVSPKTGCINTPITCADTDACTTDKCVNGTTSNAYTCSNVLVPTCRCATMNCPVIASCVINECNNDNGNCEARSKKCDDGNVCTIDSCNNSTSLGCVYNPRNCSDNNACTIDSCDATKGGCVYSNVTCDDLDICTDDSCSASIGCIFTNKSASFCDDNDKCTIDTCVHGGVGCLNKPVDCNDNDVCTTDSCDASTGSCLNVMNFECLCGRTTCPFVDNCTISYCNTTDGTCDTATVNCDDGNICTDDSCNPSSGCTYQPKVCKDTNECTVDTCDRNAIGGCVFTELDPATYDDLNACTLDYCNSTTGVHHDNITCDDKSACTIDTCQSISGCVFIDKDCGDILGAAALESKCSFAMCNASDSTGFGCYVGISPNAEFDECGDCFGKGLNCVSKVTIGIGAGIISSIVIGSLAVIGAIFAGSYGGVKAYQKYRTTMEAAHNNPLFVEKEEMGNNPLYNDDASSYEMKGN